MRPESAAAATRNVQRNGHRRLRRTAVRHGLRIARRRNGRPVPGDDPAENGRAVGRRAQTRGNLRGSPTVAGRTVIQLRDQRRTGFPTAGRPVRHVRRRRRIRQTDRRGYPGRQKNVPADYGAENRRCGHPRRTARAAARRRHVGGGENRNRAWHLRPAGSPEDHRKGDRRLFPQCRPNPQQPGSRDRTHRPAAGTGRNPVEPQKRTGLSKKWGQRAPTAKRWKR